MVLVTMQPELHFNYSFFLFWTLGMWCNQITILIFYMPNFPAHDDTNICQIMINIRYAKTLNFVALYQNDNLRTSFDSHFTIYYVDIVFCCNMLCIRFVEYLILVYARVKTREKYLIVGLKILVVFAYHYFYQDNQTCVNATNPSIFLLSKIKDQ